MKTNKFKFLLLILFAAATTTKLAAQENDNRFATKVENIRPDVTQISGRINGTMFSPSGDWMILQTDCGFYVLPAALSDEAIAKVEKSDLYKGKVKGFLPSGKIVYATSRGLFALDPATLASRSIFQLTDAEAKAAECFYERAMFVVSENLIVGEDGSYQKDSLKGSILRYDAAKQNVTRGGQIYAFDKGKLSPGGGYIFYQHFEAPEKLGNLYDVKRRVNYSISKRYRFKQHFSFLKINEITPLLWVAADKFLVRIDAYQADNYNLMPTWFALLDAATGKIIWKKEQASDDQTNLQQLSSTKALLEKDKNLFELSLANGKLTKIPDLEGSIFILSPDKKKLAYFNGNRIFVSDLKGKSKRPVLELPENWRNLMLYSGSDTGQLSWSPDGSRLFVFDGGRVLIVRL